MKHVLARTAAVLAALIFAPIAARAQTYTVIDLTPTGFTEVQATGVSGGTQVGIGHIRNTPYALLWSGTAGSVVNLGAHLLESYATAASGNSQVGYGVGHALLWHGTADSMVSLHPPQYTASYAYGVDGDAQVGVGRFGDSIAGSHALLWHGSADSVIDLNLPQGGITFAYGVSGNSQVGDGSGPMTNEHDHALLWHGSPESVIDLNPAGFNTSVATAVDGDAQVGYGDYHALLWHGTAASAVNLNPTGYTLSEALAISGNTQAGIGSKYDPVAGRYVTHALVWHGTANSAVDLNAFLPAGFRGAIALGVSSNGDIVGLGVGNDVNETFHALLWHPNKPAPSITGLNPDPVDMGHAAFTLKVTGTKFVPTTVVRWNGQTLATTYVTAQVLQAQVPASLVAQSGTVDITVQTPRVATSGAVTFHIRPLIGSLSPSTVNAGSAAFTFTVNGSGYTADAIVVFQGTNLATQFVSSTKLTALVPAALVAVRGRKSVMVTLPHVATSHGAGFDVTP